MTELNIGLVTVGALVLVLGAFSNYVRTHTVLSEPLAALAVGVLLGPAVTGVLDPRDWLDDQAVLLEEAARLTLGIGLMAVALRLPRRFPLRQWRSLAILLGLVMPLMWLVTGLLIHLLLGLPLWLALLIGAAVTPTDPIVATSVVTGELAERELPDRLRHLISAESGANDGLAHPLVFLAIFMLGAGSVAAPGPWLLGILWEIGGGILFGGLLGYGAGRLLHWAEAHHNIERISFLAYTVALSLLVLGAADLIGTVGLLAVFVAGLAFDAVVGGRERAEEAGIQDAVSQFFTLPIFALFGLMLPWNEWLELGWLGIVLAAAVLLLRRLPALLLLRPLLPALHRREEALFVGWFGPIGVAAMFYAMEAVRYSGQDQVWTAASLIIFASIIAHGLSATPLTAAFGRRSAAHRTGRH